MPRHDSSPELQLAPAPEPAPDRAKLLVERARRGDVEAWARLYQDTFDRIHRHVYFLTGDAALAEDLVQEAFARAMVTIGSYDARAPFATWMRGVALNVVRMHWRRDRTQRRVHGQIREEARETEVHAASSASAPDARHLQDQRVAILYEALKELPDPQREAFVLRELEGLSTRDAAEQLGITPNNLAVRTSRARAQIRDALRQRGCLDPTKVAP